MSYTVEELEKLENKIWSIIDAAVYGCLGVEGAVTQMLKLLEEEKKKI